MGLFTGLLRFSPFLISGLTGSNVRAFELWKSSTLGLKGLKLHRPPPSLASTSLQSALLQSVRRSAAILVPSQQLVSFISPPITAVSIVSLNFILSGPLPALTLCHSSASPSIRLPFLGLPTGLRASYRLLLRRQTKIMILR